MARFSEPDVAARLIDVWRGSTPKVQEEIITALGSRDRVGRPLLDACDRDEITAGQVPRATRTALLTHQDTRAARARREALRRQQRARAAEVIARYQAALDAARRRRARRQGLSSASAWPATGWASAGSQVGPNLALIRNRTPAALLEAILDPNREVQPSFVSYVVVDDSGRTHRPA